MISVGLIVLTHLFSLFFSVNYTCRHLRSAFKCNIYVLYNICIIPIWLVRGTRIRNYQRFCRMINQPYISLNIVKGHGSFPTTHLQHSHAAANANGKLGVSPFVTILGEHHIVRVSYFAGKMLDLARVPKQVRTTGSPFGVGTWRASDLDME